MYVGTCVQFGPFCPAQNLDFDDGFCSPAGYGQEGTLENMNSILDKRIVFLTPNSDGDQKTFQFRFYVV